MAFAIPLWIGGEATVSTYHLLGTQPPFPGLADGFFLSGAAGEVKAPTVCPSAFRSAAHRRLAALAPGCSGVVKSVHTRAIEE